MSRRSGDGSATASSRARTGGGQRTVPAAEVARLLAERRDDEPIAAASARNRFPGVITEVKSDGLAATVEIQAGPHRVVAFITREAADELGLQPGMEAVATVKATSVMVNLDRGVTPCFSWFCQT